MTLNEFLEIIILGIVSFFSNCLSALAGGGAGLVQLPALIFLGLPFPTALATHKIASVALGLGAGFRHLQEKSLKLNLVLFILISGMPGVILGANLALVFSPKILTFSLGILTLGIALYSIKKPNLGSENISLRLTPLRWCIGGFVIFIIGLLNGSLSSGTGLFITIWLVRWFGFSYAKAISYTLILVGLFWNATGAVVLGLREEIKSSWLPILILGSLLGGYYGAQISLSNGNKLVKKAFELITFSMGLSLIGRSFFT